jgi:TM2 domain-containing membrane protein YozV
MTSPYLPPHQPHPYGPSQPFPSTQPISVTQPIPVTQSFAPTQSFPSTQPFSPAQPFPSVQLPLSPPRPHRPTATPAPYGTDPASGLPLSDKSRLVVGLLQLVPGFVGGFGGIGRLYAGHTRLAVAQLVATILAWVSFVCGFILVFPFFFAFCFWLWFVVDGVVLMTGRPTTDGHGRLLRP